MRRRGCFFLGRRFRAVSRVVLQADDFHVFGVAHEGATALEEEDLELPPTTAPAAFALVVLRGADLLDSRISVQVFGGVPVLIGEAEAASAAIAHRERSASKFVVEANIERRAFPEFAVAKNNTYK